MGRTLWIAFSALFAAALVALAYQANTSTTRGGNASGAYQSSGSSADQNRYKDLRLR